MKLSELTLGVFFGISIIKVVNILFICYILFYAT